MSPYARNWILQAKGMTSLRRETICKKPLSCFWNVPSPGEITQRVSGEIYITQIEVADGQVTGALR